MPETRALLSAADRQAEIADSLGRVYARELSRVQADLERRLRRLIIEAQQGSETATGLATRSLALRNEIRGVLVLAGYDDLADAATSAGFEEMVTAIGRLRQAAELAAFTKADVTKIAALKELARLDLLAQGDEVGIAVWRSVVQGVYSTRPVNDILDDLATVLDREMHEVGTLYDTAVSIFGRQLEVLKSDGDPAELLVFVGPVDTKLRPFCERHVGKVYTAKEVDALDNGQLPNVRITGGGYNCRHVWAPVSALSELRELHGTGNRVPEIAEQVAAIRERRTRSRRVAA